MELCEKSGVKATDDIFEHDRTVKGGQDFLLQSILQPYPIKLSQRQR